ncbi:MAG: outer membrane beta-barrel protein [Candidatus Omnitrophica bacterium]|nr:outer membrane beta-barrel protein [Candidatus Omnitrophota bacterium]
MRKKAMNLFCLFFALFLFFVDNPQGLAYTYYEEDFSFTEDLSLGLRAGAVINALDNKYLFGMTAQGFRDISIIGKDGWYFEVELDKKLNKYFSVAFESGRMEYDLDFTVNPENTSGISGAMGSMEILPVVGKLKVQYPIEGFGEFSEASYKFIPYISAGVGGMFTDLSEDSYATSTGYNFNTDSSALAGKYGMGLDFYFTENFAVNLEGAYIDMDIKTDMSTQGITTTEDVHYDSWVVGGGLKYSF